MSTQPVSIDPLAPARAALAQAQIGVQALVDAYNKALVADYQGQFSAWSGNYTGGHADLSTMPTPPMAYVVGYAADPTTGPGATGPFGTNVINWPYPMQGTQPVTAALPIPPPPTPQVHPVFTGNATTMNIPPGDTLPVGSVIPAPDGSKWEKMATPTPFGLAYYYAKVS